jgi:hypothetical protein
VAKKLNYLQIIVPQGEESNPKKEHLFEQVLVNLQNTVKSKTVSLEYFGFEQYTYCYVVVPDSLLETIEGLIYSTFPDAEIYPVEDYTQRFNPEKMVFAGTSIKFKYFDVYPFKTYEAFSEDSQSNLFSVISKLASEEQIWVQIVTNPKDETASYHFKRNWAMRFARARQRFHVRDWFRAKGEQSIRKVRAEKAEEKYQFPPYDVAIRCAYIAKDQETANRKLEAVINSFYQFNFTDVQEFQASKKTNANSFLTSYRDRSLSGHQMMGVKEIASLYHYPNADHTPHIVHVLAKKNEPPQDLPKRGESDISFFGMTNYHNNYVEFGIKRSDRRRHLYATGKSGSGKSKFLEMLIKADFDDGHGVGVLDPHGDLIDAVLKYIPEHRIQDVVLFDPGDIEYPIAFNPLENVDDAYKMQLTIGFIDIFKKLFGTNWSDRLEHVLRYTTLALLDSPNTTVLSILKMLTDKNYRQTIVSRIQDSVVKNFWVSEFAGWSEKFDAEAITPLLNKVGQLVSTNMIRNILGQPGNKFDIRQMMDEKKILLMKVSKGLLGEENSGLLGSMIITKIYQAAMQRADMEESKREDFYLYIDEFHNFATDTFAEILSEARKYHLNLTIANQYIGQLIPVVQKTVFGNIGSVISFRVGADDAGILAAEYNPIFKERDIINLGVREFYIKMSVNGEIREAFSARTLNAPPVTNDCTQQIIEHSRNSYCKPKDEVEKLLSKWDEAGEFSEENLAPEYEQEFEEPLI